MEERHFRPRPFGEAYRIVQRRKRKMIGEMSTAQWERVFTSRKRTIMQKASDIEMSTRCQVTLTIRSPAGQVWYYATSEELRQKMIKSVLIDSSSFRVTREALENNLVPIPENIGRCTSLEREVIHKQSPEPPQTSILHAQLGREEPCPGCQSNRSNPLTRECSLHGNQSDTNTRQPTAKQGKTQKSGPCDYRSVHVKDIIANQHETQKSSLRHNDPSPEEPTAEKRCKRQKSDFCVSQTTHLKQSTIRKNCKPNEPSKKEEARKTTRKNTVGRLNNDKSSTNKKLQETTIKNTHVGSTVKKSNNYEKPRLNKNSIKRAANNNHIVFSESEGETKSEQVSSDTCMTPTRKTQDLSRSSFNTANQSSSARRLQTAGVVTQQNLNTQTDKVSPARAENAFHKSVKHPVASRGSIPGFARFPFQRPQCRFPTEAELEEERRHLPPHPDNTAPTKPHVPPKTRSESSSSSTISDSDDSSDNEDDSSSSTSSSSEDERRSLQTTATVETLSKSPGTLSDKVLSRKPQKKQQKKEIPGAKPESPSTSNLNNFNCFVKFEKNPYDFFPSPMKVPKQKNTTGPKKGKNLKKKANQKKKVAVSRKIPSVAIKNKTVQTNQTLKCSVNPKKNKPKKKRKPIKRAKNNAQLAPCKGTVSTAKLSQVPQSKAKVKLGPGESNIPVIVKGHGERTPCAVKCNDTINGTSNTNCSKGSISQNSETKSIGHSTSNTKQANEQNFNARKRRVSDSSKCSLNKSLVESRFSKYPQNGSCDKFRRNSESENDSHWKMKCYHNSREQCYQHENVPCGLYQNQPDGNRQVFQTSLYQTNLVQGTNDYTTKTSDLKKRLPMLGEKPDSIPHTYPLHGLYQNQPERNKLQTSLDKTNLVQGNSDYNTKTSDLKRRPPLLGEKPDLLPHTYPSQKTYSSTSPDGSTRYSSSWPNQWLMTGVNDRYNPHRDNRAFCQSAQSELQDFENQLRDGVHRPPKHKCFNKQPGGKHIGFRNAHLDKNLRNLSENPASTEGRGRRLSTGPRNKKSAGQHQNCKPKTQQQKIPPKARPNKSPRLTIAKKAVVKVRPFSQIRNERRHSFERR